MCICDQPVKCNHCLIVAFFTLSVLIWIYGQNVEDAAYALHRARSDSIYRDGTLGKDVTAG